jgi:hypothetical protein
MTPSARIAPLGHELARVFVLLGLALLSIFVVLPGLLALAAAAGG